MTNNWYGYEILTESSSFLGAYLDQKDRDKEFTHLMHCLNQSEIETYILGIVHAPDLDGAHTLIRLGEWEEFTQKV